MALLFIILSSIGATRIPFWPFLLCLSLLGVILYSKAINPNHWQLLVRSIMSPRAVQQLIREENTMENTFSGLLLLTFFFSMTLFLQNINDFYGLTISIHPLLTFAIILVAVLFVYVVKVATLYLLQWVFEVREIFEEYIVGLLNINIVLGISLLPLNILIIYGLALPAKPLIYIGIALLAFSLALRLLRIVEMGRRREMNAYNIILYLCTLEIVPILLLLKLMENLGIGRLTL